MYSGAKVVQAAAVVAVGMMAFSGGAYFMVNDALENTPPLPEVANFDPGVTPQPFVFQPTGLPLDDPKQAAVPNLGWTVKTAFGLPAPRKLSEKEKAGLRLLGNATDTHTFDFNRMVLEDGSTIPAKPCPKGDEVKECVAGWIRKAGLADGFEAAVRELAPRGMRFLTVQIGTEPDWADVEAVLGKPDGKSEDDVWLKPPTGHGSAHYRVAWIRHGWLEFGIGEGKVRVIKANMRHADIVAAESVPDGRSAPDPARAAARKKQRPKRSPTEPPAEVDALRLLGAAAEVRVTTRRTGLKDPQLDRLVRDAQQLKGMDIYPGAIETARRLKQSLRSEYLVITPTNQAPIDQITDLLGDPNSTQTDPSPKAGGVTWYRYFWLEFSAIGGKVTSVRLNCLMTPNYGL